jgi:hypothetical protein
MTTVVLLGLAALWTTVLLPGWVGALRDRTGRRNTMDAWAQQLKVLGSKRNQAVPAGSPPGARVRTSDSFGHRRPRTTVPQRPKEAAQRRKDIVRLLILLAVASLVIFMATGQLVVLVAHTVFDAALVGYFVLLSQRRQLEADRMAKVHYLHPVPESAPAGLARRSAN